MLGNLVAGGGKTLLMGLAPRLVGARRGVLFIEANNIVGHRNLLREAQEHWLVVDPDTFPIYSYEKGFYIPGFDAVFLIAALGVGLVVIARKRR